MQDLISLRTTLQLDLSFYGGENQGSQSSPTGFSSYTVGKLGGEPT